jgi:putative ABC transport system substrate-binding protein
MQRRRFISLSLCLLTPAMHARAAATISRVGLLIPGASSDGFAGPAPRIPSLQAFLRGMAERGYAYGEKFVTVAQGAGDRADLYPSMAAQLVKLEVDVIVAPGPVLGAIKSATNTIPVVMAAGADPVEEGLVQSLARPGTNFTGLSIQFAETMGKRLERLLELAPGGQPVAVLYEPQPQAEAAWRALQAAAQARGWKVVPVTAHDTATLDTVLRSLETARARSLLVIAGGLMDQNAQRIVDYAEAHRLPAMYSLPSYVQKYGGLAYYSPDLVEVWRAAAGYVVKLLEGARPNDLPIEQAKSDFEISRRAANAIGLTMPESLRLFTIK